MSSAISTTSTTEQATNVSESTETTQATPSPLDAFSIDAYRTGDKKVRDAFRASVAKIGHDATMNLNAELARDAAIRLDEFKATPRTTTPTIDWNGLVTSRIRDLRDAADLLETGVVIPSGAPDGFRLVITPDLFGPISDAAWSMAEAPVRRSTKQDLRTLIAAAFADLPTGTFRTVSQIVSMVTALDTCPADYVPGTGAISAALMSESGVDGVTGIASNPKKGIKAGGRRS